MDISPGIRVFLVAIMIDRCSALQIQPDECPHPSTTVVCGVNRLQTCSTNRLRFYVCVSISWAFQIDLLSSNAVIIALRFSERRHFAGGLLSSKQRRILEKKTAMLRNPLSHSSDSLLVPHSHLMSPRASPSNHIVHRTMGNRCHATSRRLALLCPHPITRPRGAHL